MRWWGRLTNSSGALRAPGRRPRPDLRRPVLGEARVGETHRMRARTTAGCTHPTHAEKTELLRATGAVEDGLMGRGLGLAAMPQEVFLNRGHADLLRRDLRGEMLRQTGQLGHLDPAAPIEPEEQPPRLVGRGVAQLDLAVDPTGPERAGSSRSGWLVVMNSTRPSRELTPSSALSRPLRVTPVWTSVARCSLKTQSTSSMRSSVAAGRPSTRVRMPSSEHQRLLRLRAATESLNSPARASDHRRLAGPGRAVQEVAAAVGDARSAYQAPEA